MPRSTRTSSTASDGAASSSAAGDEEKTMDDENRKKVSKDERAKQRELLCASIQADGRCASIYFESRMYT